MDDPVSAAGRNARMTRVWAIFATLVFASPATAWDFAETNVCTVTHDASNVFVAVTFDPTTEIYELTLTLKNQTWGNGHAFRIVFDGQNPIVIGTDRQTLSEDQTQLRVSDRGFGNVLDGIQFNETMTASLEDQSIAISLTGAAGPMAAFRLCPTIATS